MTTNEMNYDDKEKTNYYLDTSTTYTTLIIEAELLHYV